MKKSGSTSVGYLETAFLLLFSTRPAGSTRVLDDLLIYCLAFWPLTQHYALGWRAEAVLQAHYILGRGKFLPLDIVAKTFLRLLDE